MLLKETTLIEVENVFRSKYIQYKLCLYRFMYTLLKQNSKLLKFCGFKNGIFLSLALLVVDAPTFVTV